MSDILRIDFEVGTNETEKQFELKIGDIDFKLDIFDESVDKRNEVNIQRIDGDYHLKSPTKYIFVRLNEVYFSSKYYLSIHI